MDLHAKLNQGLLIILYKPERNIGFHWITSYILYKTIAGVEYYFDVPHRVTEILIEMQSLTRVSQVKNIGQGGQDRLYQHNIHHRMFFS
jgi:hypothetical protein